MSGRRGEFRIGTSGYQYDHWQGKLYPEDLPKRAWFGRYAEEFDTVEINNTFYHLPAAKTFDDWRERAPKGFLYVLKFSRYGSHLKALKDPEGTIGRFMERAERLGVHLGPILVQLRPNWKADPERLAEFLDAARGDRRWAVEFRDRSWLCDDVYEVLRGHGAAVCIHDMIRDHPEKTTANWVYLRYHGKDYGGSYSHQALTAEAGKIEGHLKDGRDVYAFFNNDAHGYAVNNARDLRRYVADRAE